MFVAYKYTALYYECSSTDLELPVIDVHCISLKLSTVLNRKELYENNTSS